MIEQGVCVYCNIVTKLHLSLAVKATLQLGRAQYSLKHFTTSANMILKYFFDTFLLNMFLINKRKKTSQL